MHIRNMKLNHLGSLITVGDPGPDGKETCLGYLMNFNGRGVYSPDGKVEVTPEDCEAHNKALSQAEIDGLDNNCDVGQWGTFYYTPKPDKKFVTTFTGTVVSTDVYVHGQVITFHRNSKTYRGRLQKDAECFNFKRIK
jgi:hypothetical protein